MKNIRVFVSENFQFLEVKFSIYLNRRVFVMKTQICASVESDQSSLSTSRNFASLAIQNTPSADSDQTARMRTRMSNGTFL